MRLLIILLLVLNSAFAETLLTNQLITITDDESDELSFFMLYKNEFNAIKGFSKDIYDRYGNLIEVQEYSVSGAPLNIVLERRSGFDIIILRSENFCTINGGIGEIDYLYSGISGTRRSFPINLALINGNFRILNKIGNPISNLHFITNRKRPFGTIGIKRIVPTYD